MANGNPFYIRPTAQQGFLAGLQSLRQDMEARRAADMKAQQEQLASQALEGDRGAAKKLAVANPKMYSSVSAFFGEERAEQKRNAQKFITSYNMVPPGQRKAWLLNNTPPGAMGVDPETMATASEPQLDRMIRMSGALMLDDKDYDQIYPKASPAKDGRSEKQKQLNEYMDVLRQYGGDSVEARTMAEYYGISPSLHKRQMQVLEREKALADIESTKAETGETRQDTTNKAAVPSEVLKAQAEANLAKTNAEAQQIQQAMENQGRETIKLSDNTVLDANTMEVLYKPEVTQQEKANLALTRAKLAKTNAEAQQIQQTMENQGRETIKLGNNTVLDANTMEVLYKPGTTPQQVAALNLTRAQTAKIRQEIDTFGQPTPRAEAQIALDQARVKEIEAKLRRGEGLTEKDELERERLRLQNMQLQQKVEGSEPLTLYEKEQLGLRKKENYRKQVKHEQDLKKLQDEKFTQVRSIQYGISLVDDMLAEEVNLDLIYGPQEWLAPDRFRSAKGRTLQAARETLSAALKFEKMRNVPGLTPVSDADLKSLEQSASIIGNESIPHNVAFEELKRLRNMLGEMIERQGVKVSAPPENAPDVIGGPQYPGAPPAPGIVKGGGVFQGFSEG